MLFLGFPAQFDNGTGPAPNGPHRALPKTIAERRDLARRIVALPFPNTEQTATLAALGHDAVPAMLSAYGKATPSRREDLGVLIVRAVQPADTPAIYALSTRYEKPFDNDGAEDSPVYHPFGRWLIENGEPEFLSVRYLPAFLSKRDFSRQVTYLPCLLRSRNRLVIDTLFGILKNPAANPYLRRGIGEGIAQCERPDVLRRLLAMRSTARKRSKPNPDLPADQDSDGDGLPDNVDINPYAAPRPQIEEERVMQIAFESQVGFLDTNGRLAAMDYPKGYAPFELKGYDGTIVPISRLNEEEVRKEDPRGGFKYLHLSASLVPVDPNGKPNYRRTETEKTTLPKGATTAVVEFDMVGAPLGGAGRLIRLRKIRGQWFVVGAEMTWVS